MEGNCGRCDGTGIIHSWCGRRGLGGRTGPCPKCQVEGARRFLTELANETFPVGPAREARFRKAFTQGE